MASLDRCCRVRKFSHAFRMGQWTWCPRRVVSRPILCYPARLSGVAVAVYTRPLTPEIMVIAVIIVVRHNHYHRYHRRLHPQRPSSVGDSWPRPRVLLPRGVIETGPAAIAVCLSARSKFISTRTASRDHEGGRAPLAPLGRCDGRKKKKKKDLAVHGSFRSHPFGEHRVARSSQVSSSSG